MASRGPDRSPIVQTDPATRRLFGFDLDADAWMGRMRGYCAGPQLGMLGPYQLLATAGRGGQGLVFKARQPRTGREVAIKRLAAGQFSTPEMHARFQREVEAVAALEHPHIVTVFGSEVVDGQPVLVMQWIDGVPFDHWARPMEGVTRPLAEILDAFAKVCDAVHHAHHRGVIHRDLKPTNVLVDSAGEPHVLDFGLARRNDDSSNDPQLTLSGAVIGTPAFSPPEQLRGDARDVDERSDVYSLGAMLYRGLTGSTPVDPQLSHAAMAAHIERAGPRSPALLNTALDREVSAIVLKALQPEPAQRFQSVEALAEDVRRYRSGRPVLAHPPGAGYRLRKFVRRNGFVLSVVVAIIGVLAVAGSIAVYQSARLNDALARESHWQGAVAQSQQSGTDSPESIRAVSAMAEQRYLDADYVGAEELYRKLVEHHRVSPDARDFDKRRAMSQLYQSLNFQERWADMIPIAEDGLRQARTQVGDPHRWVSGWFTALGVLRAKVGDAPGARTALEESLKILTTLISNERTRSAATTELRNCLRELGLTLTELGRLDEGEAALREALADHESRTSPTEVTRTGVAKVWLGDCLFRAGRMDEVEALLLEGQGLIGANLDYVGCRLAAARNLVTLYEATGRTADAAHWRECIRSKPIRDWAPPGSPGPSAPPSAATSSPSEETKNATP